MNSGHQSPVQKGCSRKRPIKVELHGTFVAFVQSTGVYWTHNRVESTFRETIRKKRDYVGKIPKWRTPPPVPSSTPSPYSSPSSSSPYLPYSPPSSPFVPCIPISPERYLFLGSTQYYTIFWVFIRYTILSHDICNMSDFVKNARKLQEMRH